MISAFDTAVAFPKYTDKIEGVSNINNTRHLLKGNKKMSQVLWEAGLRSSYGKFKSNKVNEGRSKPPVHRHREGR